MLSLILFSVGCVEPTPPNTPPAIELVAPLENDILSTEETATFLAQVSDEEDPARNLRVRWYSDRDGVLDEATTPGLGGLAQLDIADLSPGAHEIEAFVNDSRGGTASARASITVRQPDQSPELTRLTPAANDLAEEGVPFYFSATVSDTQDAPESLEVTVSSDRVGTFIDLSVDASGLAAGEALLPEGRHYLTFTVWDTDGNDAAETLLLTVLAADTIDHDGDGWAESDGDCDDSDDALHPGVLEVCDGLDNDCDGTIDEDTLCGDDDGDGFSEEEGDCDDSARQIYPGAAEVWYDGVDQDCAGDDDLDRDGDGYRWNNTGWDDCDDGDPTIHPGAAEVCDGRDTDCDGDIDEGATTTFYPDHDGDGYGNPDYPEEACSAPSGYVSDGTDCYDYNADAWPGSSASKSTHRGDGSWDYDCSD